MAEWVQDKSVEPGFIHPGRPRQDGFIERFNGSYRRGVLDRYVFRNRAEVREQTERWLGDSDEQIPHDAPGGLTPTVPSRSPSGNLRSRLALGTESRQKDLA